MWINLFRFVSLGSDKKPMSQTMDHKKAERGVRMWSGEYLYRYTPDYLSMKPYQIDLENRLIAFAVNIGSCRSLQGRSLMERHLAGQLSRSATAPALLYAEATSSESLDDLIHKLSLVLKELRETKVNLRIWVSIQRPQPQIEELQALIDEADQLVALFSTSVNTLRERRKQRQIK